MNVANQNRFIKTKNYVQHFEVKCFVSTINNILEKWICAMQCDKLFNPKRIKVATVH